MLHYFWSLWIHDSIDNIANARMRCFQGIEKYTKVAGGYTTIGNVKNALDTRPRDMMESFFLGETLKYLYLLFADRQESDSFISLHGLISKNGV